MRHLKSWMVEPIILPRWMLYVLYALFVVLGIVLAIVGSPSIDLTTPAGYLRPYGCAVAGSALVALVGAQFSRHPLTECISAFLLFALLTVYIASTVGPWIGGDLNRGALGVIVTIASLLPLFRCTVLFAGIVTKRQQR